MTAGIATPCVGGTDAAFAGLDDLIRMKEAAGRPKDLADLQVLRTLKGNLGDRDRP